MSVIRDFFRFIAVPRRLVIIELSGAWPNGTSCDIGDLAVAVADATRHGCYVVTHVTFGLTTEGLGPQAQINVSTNLGVIRQVIRHAGSDYRYRLYHTPGEAVPSLDHSRHAEPHILIADRRHNDERAYIRVGLDDITAHRPASKPLNGSEDAIWQKAVEGAHAGWSFCNMHLGHHTVVPFE